jgi:PPOX class probable F420-dependent enzyme
MASTTDYDHQLPQEVVALFGDSMRIAYISTLRPDGGPAVVPVGMMIHDNKLRISSRTATKKIRNLQRDPRLSVCVTDPDNLDFFLMINGTADLAEDSDRVFVDWMARTHMGRDQYPFEPRSVARTIVTIRPELVVVRTRDAEQAGRTRTVRV